MFSSDRAGTGNYEIRVYSLATGSTAPLTVAERDNTKQMRRMQAIMDSLGDV
ncbi:hypothetical protein Q5425_28030 [Amycolatopsis sp. A133]|uniref:hypothetical protein n=1 Tax=Amycolatopsis sp. A133 TaxID=3064472 RepID=UPI0027E6E231|nr:hypothetical protein [Amycolatopsis sp. A133]MDQ7807603.1 hypothetical protein [Amycolatopsis sp. A133]